MKTLLEKYSANFPSSRWSLNSSHKDVESENQPQTILITGTTGRLGSHLLSQLLHKSEIVRVYALNRGTGGELGAAKLEMKQREAFKMWKLDDGVLSSAKVSFHVADLNKPYLGLDEKTYDEVCKLNQSMFGAELLTKS